MTTLTFRLTLKRGVTLTIYKASSAHCTVFICALCVNCDCMPCVMKRQFCRYPAFPRMVGPIMCVRNALICSRRHEHITPIFKHHSIIQRIQFKILLLTFKTRNGQCPTYLSELIQQKVPSTQLRSSTSSHLQLMPGPCVKTRYGDRAFSVAAPKLWNTSPSKN